MFVTRYVVNPQLRFVMRCKRHLGLRKATKSRFWEVRCKTMMTAVRSFYNQNGNKIREMVDCEGNQESADRENAAKQNHVEVFYPGSKKAIGKRNDGSFKRISKCIFWEWPCLR
jgi:hypothetical protein